MLALSKIKPGCEVKMLASENQPTVDAVRTCEFHPLGKVIVVGSGPVGMRFVDELLQRSPLAEVHLFGNEPFPPYNRVLLSSLLSGKTKLESIQISLPSIHDHPNFTYSVAAIKNIDQVTQTIEDGLGNCHHYDHLILATGARAHIPNISGNQAQGVYTFRNMRDTEVLYSRMASARHVVVVGGGLLGIEAAKGLLRLNTQVTLVQQGSRLMNRQLDDEAASLLAEKIAQLGIRVITSSGVREIFVDGRVTGVRTFSGEKISCDTVLLSAGIRPNMELARNSGIQVASGVVVDDRLSTSVENIYAIGECCEHRSKTYGLVGPGLEQAAVVAENLCGGSALYSGSITVSRLKVIGEEVVSLGEVTELLGRPRQFVLTFRQRNRGCYRKIIVNKGVLTGAVGFGEWPEFTRLQEMFKSGRRVWVWQMVWFWILGRLWLFKGAENIQQWPSNAIVCQCNQVAKGELERACLTGANTVNQLSDRTRAGNVCGSCKPLLAQLLGMKQEKIKHWQTLLIMSVIAVVIVSLVATVPAAEVAASVQVDHWFEKIWNDKSWKQVTGFSLLAMVVVGMSMSLRKRFNWRWMGDFGGWRVLHSVLGVGSAALIIFHTGFHLGENLNRWLMFTFLSVLILGSVAGCITSLSHRFLPARAQAVQKSWSFLHLLVSWPLPVLLIFHILTVYYF